MSNPRKPTSARVERVREGIETMREQIARFDAEARAVLADDRYSAEYKREQIAGLRADRLEVAAYRAKQAWRQLATDLQTAQEHYQQRSAAAESRWDYSRLAVLQAEYSALLARPENPLIGDYRPARVLRELERAQAAGDVHRTRALRIAAAGIEDGSVVAALDRAEAAEVPEDVREAAREVASLEQGRALLRGEILSAEAAIGGRPSFEALFGATPWQRAVLGEDATHNGGGVFWAGEPVRAGVVTE